jgi:diaminohydroxyphosphoribosylaminopyrimidine deaminase/5-amino-6-(5-phosphoribosylamino)uracil reductase
MRKKDEFWMRRALHLAGRGGGRTSPNPMVGAILIKEGLVIGEGYHQRAGEPHAERLALERAGQQAKGSTLYINLEPCTHYGKTPPCVPAILEAGVSRVVIGMEDPNPLVKGEGIRALKEAGLEVEIGILEKECRRLNEAFCKYILKKEPFVILKIAATLDGRIATRTGVSQWITSEESRRFVHRLRDQVDGVLVGVGTILRDDPLLTTRLPGGRDPYRIVLDSQLRIPEDSKILHTNPQRLILATTERAPREKLKRLEPKVGRMMVCPMKEGRVDLKALVSRLGEMEMMSLLVEGGSRVNGAFLDERLIDKVLLFLSPKCLGDPQALGIFGGRGIENLKEALSLKEMRVRRIGEDLLVEGYMEGD